MTDNAVPETTSGLRAEDSKTLCSLLAAEFWEYRRLLRLAWRQNHYLRRHDVGRLENNAAEWRKYLPTAEAARCRREQFLGELQERLGLEDQEATPQLFLKNADHEGSTEVRDALAELVRTAGDLCRQNEINRQLAGFCCDLVREEAEIFKRCVLEDPVGCYEEDAQRTVAAPGGVLTRQA